MRRSISVLIAAAVVSSAVNLTPATAMPAAPTATSNNGPAVQLVRDRWGGGRHWRGGHRGYWRGGGHWGGGYYGHRGYDYGLGLGAFGLATGLLLGSQFGYRGYGHLLRKRLLRRRL